MSNNSGPATAKERLRKLANPKKPAFWGILLAAAIVVYLVYKLVGLIPWGVGKLGDFTGGKYAVEEETYTFFLDKEDVYWPSFEVSENMELSVLEEDGQWVDCGTMEKIRLNSKNFESLFADYSKGWLMDSPSKLSRENGRAWFVTDEEGNMYYLLQQQTGALYMAVGEYDDSGIENSSLSRTRIFWVFKLKAQ